MDEEKKEGKEEEYKKPEEEYKKPEVYSNMPKGEKTLTDKLRGNPFILSTVICGVLVVLLLVMVLSGGITGNVVSKESAGETLVEFLNNVADSEVTLVDVEDVGNFYLATIEFKGQEMPIYVTKDGEYYTSNLLPLVLPEEANTNTGSQEVPKSDKPVVELFVMTHCPYGTQAEKGLLPVIESLGDTVDAKIRFVHYFMHDPEKTETPIQVCIREEQSEKYLEYLKCFLEDGDSDRCLTATGINKAKLSECIDSNSEGYYEADSALSKEYSVQGSPTLVINGVQVSSGRSPAAYLSTICQAFNEMPSFCDLELSTASPTEGF
jgi:protein-disulfide isomerase